MSMTVTQLEETLAEARRFVKLADKVHATLRQSEADYANEDLKYWERAHVSPKDTGAVRRASMDLTRSLADLRRA